MTYIQISDNGRHKTYFCRYDLYRMEFRFNRKHKDWTKVVKKDSDIQTAESYCKQMHLSFRLDLPEYRRSSDYRRTFFQSKPGLFGRFYYCSYCGRLLTRKQVTIDHLIPVNAAGNSRFFRWLLGKCSIGNVNDLKNLVPACSHCNSSKGKKTGLWILWGIIGRHSEFWIVIRICLILSFAVAAYKYGLK